MIVSFCVVWKVDKNNNLNSITVFSLIYCTTDKMESPGNNRTIIDLRIVIK